MAGRVFLVTGAFGALGSAVAQAAAEQGACVALVDYAKAPSSPTPDGALALGGVDLTDANQAGAAIEAAAERFGGIDALLNIAGGFAWETIADGGAATWDRLYALNVKTALNACRAALPMLGAGASIVNIGAAAAARAEAGMGAYAASKSGVARLTEALAAELKPRRIRANAILPSIIDTPANRADMPKAAVSKWVTPDEIAEVIAFLLSAAASGVTGALIPVTGRV